MLLAHQRQDPGGQRSPRERDVVAELDRERARPLLGVLDDRIVRRAGDVRDHEARERANVDHSKIFMAVLLQEGINSESSGVMISTDPFDTENKGAIYISAKRGLGIKVVEGQRIAEQIIFRPRTNAIQVLTRSAEDSLLTFDDNGGVKEVPITGDRVVLTDEVIRRLVRAATDIKRVFGRRDQDIEWAYMKGQIYIVQSRPFIPGG